ncbi:DNA double-strand break repair nuclease NurA [Ignicoccus hospitalis]|uniref:NurA domain-containing protein n=1 Tax=Ignicoccus hospitalis (strain KIN4/I / DSM 18386 / JCM 14125) TaxID=453591 RepID=A8A9I4_IGNH4|nr:DNA double-strand break repair nuclease NurA [Ignicoccus hospitalis]ABU81586.1 hypothetical protein Igni_0403 [Ignicoccus hospitalis KIN4/I]HIH90521.1 DNA double-strand break repair nuclease NurA [Desulfurococcaceae archaeon]
MTDIFVDIFFKKVEGLKPPRGDPPEPLPLSELPEPEDGEVVGVDGGGGGARLGGLNFLVARAVAVGEGYLDKDLEVEALQWDSSAALEAMRSSMELKLASRSPRTTFVDGSAYTELVKWVARVVRVARGTAKLSEIVALPKTLEALYYWQELAKREDVAFVSKHPMVKTFREYLEVKKRGGKVFEKYVRGKLTTKELKELIKKPVVPDAESLRGEGVTFGLALGLPEGARNLLLPRRWKAIMEMALENYRLYVGEEPEAKLPEDLCFSKAPVAWWASYGRWKVLVEEFSGKPLCLSRYREEVSERPKNLGALLAGSGSTYNAWLALAHGLSTLKGEQLMEYIKIIGVKLGISVDEVREDLIYLMRG